MAVERQTLTGKKNYLGLMFGRDEAIAAATPALIVDLDSGVIIDETPLADHLFDYIPGELIGKNISDLIPFRFRTAHTKYFDRYSSRPTYRTMGSGDLKIIGLKRDGSEIPLTIGLYPCVLQNIRCVVAVCLQSGGSTLEQAVKSHPDIPMIPPEEAMLDKTVLILLGVWALIYGIFAVTNLQVVWSQPIMGFAALALGVVCLIRALR